MSWENMGVESEVESMDLLRPPTRSRQLVPCQPVSAEPHSKQKAPIGKDLPPSSLSAQLLGR